MSEELTIEYRRLDEVAALRWGRNPKLHDLGALAESIRRHGLIDPPGWDRNLNGGYGGLLYGNGRDEALEWMHAHGEAPPRGVKVDTDGMWLIPVKVGVDQVSEEEAEAAAIAHNNLTMAGGPFTPYQIAEMWESSAYTDILSSLATSGTLPITVDGDALDGLLKGMIPEVEPGAGGDDFDTSPSDGPTRCQPGELWLIEGKHRLLVGDCTDPANVARLMGGEKTQGVAIVSDPPYGVDYDTDYSRFSGSGSIDIPADKRNTHAPIASDKQPFDPSHLLVYRQVILWGANCYSNRLPLGTFLIWDKRHPDGTKNILSDAEIGWVNRGHGAYIFSHTWDGVVRASERGEVLHPTQKPVALFEWCMRWVDEKSAVFDPYAGSGPVFVAAHRTGRRAYLMEISPKYADVILRRAEAEHLECRLLTE